jgi:hypothetical protein
MAAERVGIPGIIALAAALWILPSGGAVAQEPSLDQTLHAAAEYVAAYEEALAVVVGEEEYVQRLRTLRGGPVRETRLLESDVVLVHSREAGLPWFLFRDVYRVDGALVRDRQARLETLFLKPPDDARERARAIAGEAARYNLGRSTRNYNVPTLVLAFLDASMRSRFTFEQTGSSSVGGRTFTRITFRENTTPTIVRRPSGDGNVFASGSFLVDPGSGAIARTELALVLEGDGVETTSELVTRFRPEPSVALWVPEAMDEELEVHLVGRRGRSGPVEYVQGFARYHGFHRPQVTTEEQFRLPDE